MASNVITINIAGLTAAGQQLAICATEARETVANLSFEVVTTGEMITMDDEYAGAYASSPVFGHSAEININRSWVGAQGAIINSYGFQTYVHGFGHALGLGHQGDYGGDASDDQIQGFENVRGSNFDDVLIGDAGRNVIYGGDGDDFLSGLSGNDVLHGGAGAGAFVFVSDTTDIANPQISGGSVTRIRDFTPDDDSIPLFPLPDSTASFEILPVNIVSNATGQAETPDQFLIYNSTTGELSIGYDGSGLAYEAIIFADLSPDLTLTVDNLGFGF